MHAAAPARSSCSALLQPLSLKRRLLSTMRQQNFDPKLHPQHERCPHQSQRIQSHRHQEGRAFLSVQQALVPLRAGSQTEFRQGSEPRRHLEICRHWRMDLPAPIGANRLKLSGTHPYACAAMLHGRTVNVKPPDIFVSPEPSGAKPAVRKQRTLHRACCAGNSMIHCACICSRRAVR